MNITKDEWSPLFRSIKAKIAPDARKALLREIIDDLKQQSVDCFGPFSAKRPQPWAGLRDKYARRVGRTNATLVLTDDERKRVGKDVSLPHLSHDSSFQTTADDKSASLTNNSEYADVHQFGNKNTPARPFYPVTQDGQTLIPSAEERLRQIVDRHFSEM